MPAFICTRSHALRPLWRALSSCELRPGRHPAPRLMRATRRSHWAAVTDVISAAPISGRGQPQRGAHGRRCSPACPSSCRRTINRLCGSGMDRSARSARIKSGEARLMIAGGVESMSARLSDAQGRSAFSRSNTSTTRRSADGSQQADEGTVRVTRCRDRREVGGPTSNRARRAGPHGAGVALKLFAAQKSGFFDAEITPGQHRAEKRARQFVVAKDEHPRETSLESARQAQGRRAPEAR